MTSESLVLGRRNTVLAAVIGTVLASYAGSASALEFEFDNGGRLNWNTTVSVGASWRAEDPNRRLYTRADGSAIGLYNAPMIPGTFPGPDDGLAGNHAAGDGNLNYAKGDRFTTPFKLITDLEYKKDRWGGLVRVKAWYDQALNEEKVRYGSQANEYNGVRKGLGPTPGYRLCSATESANWNASLNCMPVSPPGQNLWPRAKLSDRGFEAEQKFDNVYLLDAYVYGSFDVGETDLQLRLGRQVVNWGESIFIQGVNQINPIDVPAARRAGAELKEILMPVELIYLNWGLSFGSIEAFYQLRWDNTSVDACGTYFTATSTLVGANPGSCRSLTPIGNVLGSVVNGQHVAQTGSLPYMAAAGVYVPAVNGIEPSDSGQFGLAFRFPVDAIDTEIGLYGMNIHSRLPYTGGYGGTSPDDLPAPIKDALTKAGIIGKDAYGPFWASGATRFRNMFPALEAGLEAQLKAQGITYDMQSGVGFWQYPEDIQIFGISAATNLFGWSTSAEVSFQKDVPVQINGNDFLLASYLGIGPVRDEAAEVNSRAPGDRRFDGYDQFDKTQAQLNFVKTYSNYLGADNIVLVGEVGGQWNDVSNYKRGGPRYGRGFMYGTGSGPEYAPGGTPQGQPALIQNLQGNWCSPTLVGAPIPVPNPSQMNPQPEGCRNDGYVTDMAWGYRLRAALTYNNVFSSGVGVTPSVFWSDDVNGVSMDPTFNEGRSTLGLGLKFDLAKRYVLDFNYVTYADKTFDPLFDRDYYSASFSVTF